MDNHVAALMAKHAEIEHLIATEASRPAGDDMLVVQLKKQKLRIKQTLDDLSRA